MKNTNLNRVIPTLVLLFAVALLLPVTAAVAQDKKEIKVVGVLTDEGVECPALRSDDNQLYTLTPRDLHGFKVGDRVRVKGKVAERSFCQQGTTLEVSKIEAAKE